MKRIFSFLLMCICISSINAQNRAKDSLKLLLLNEKTDTGRVIRLAELSFEYLESKPDTTMVLALEALSLASKIGFVKGEAISLNRVGNAYRAFGNNYPKAMEIYLQALKLNEKINNTDGIQRNYVNIGAIYNLQGDYRLALEYFLKSKELAEKINNKASISIVLTNIGKSYYHLKIYDSARIYQLLAYDVAFGINYSRVIGGSQSDLGDIYFETGQNALAIEFYRFSITYLKKAEHDRGLSKTYLGMAKVFEKNIQNDSALYYAKLSLQIAQRIGLIHQVRDAGRFLSSYYRNMRIQDSAYFYQDITKAANDSLFSQQKSRQFQTLVFDEKLRQADIAAAELKDKKKRNNNLQYAAIALGLITFVILFLLLSHSIVANQKLIRFFGVVALLLVFEFINLFIHPYLSHATNDSPLIMLLVMVCIAALLVPAHHRLEKWISHRLVEK
ncbi:MAG: tetratricopeptide repeat protein, partial [Chitinophagaceae bacterium]|nr:tetratricopeptide repeat protein [Chitinophagaceae bacterium]